MRNLIGFYKKSGKIGEGELGREMTRTKLYSQHTMGVFGVESEGEISEEGWQKFHLQDG
ncbi:MAG: hypothetical protein NPIRA06_06400 [Nitrospirales bacterium]|nr:MAG: hypothetical protein NPIRA06_06400 [Nitrospirales bacterium]